MTATGLALGYAADVIFGDPRRAHPVAAFGTVALRTENLTYSDDRRSGALHSALLVGCTTAVGFALGLPKNWWWRTATTALCTWAVLGGRSLEREANAIHRQLDRGDLTAARRQVTHLVGRDPSQLDGPEIARATIESVAENTSDAVVAPLFWGALFGPAGLLGYRAANTLDAMVGHRSPRYQNFGWASARLDDALNLAPSRLTAVAIIAAAPLVRGSSGSALRAWRNDASKHPSPNAGPVEAAFAGTLEVQLGGVNTYGGVTEDRGTLGDGRPVTIDDVQRAVLLARVTSAISLGVAIGIAATRGPRRPY